MPRLLPILGANANGVNPRPPMFRSLGIAASGLDAQRLRMDVAAANIANAGVTRTPEGGPYRRQVVEMQTATAQQFTRALQQAQELQAPVAAELPPVARVAGDVTKSHEYGVTVTGIREDASDGARVYEPGHPDADADGYVLYPNVRVTDETIELMDARRLFEANATVFQVAKAMLRRAIDI